MHCDRHAQRHGLPPSCTAAGIMDGTQNDRPRYHRQTSVVDTGTGTPAGSVARLCSPRPCTRLATVLDSAGLNATTYAIPPVSVPLHRLHPPVQMLVKMRILDSTVKAASGACPPCLYLAPAVYTLPTGSGPIARILNAVYSVSRCPLIRRNWTKANVYKLRPL